MHTSATRWSTLVWAQAISSTGKCRRGLLAAGAVLQGRGARVLCQCTISRTGSNFRGMRSWSRANHTVLRAASPCLSAHAWASAIQTASARGSPAPLHSRSPGALDSLLFWGQAAALAFCWRRLRPSGLVLIQRQWDSSSLSPALFGTWRRWHTCLTSNGWKLLLVYTFTDIDLGSTATFSTDGEITPPRVGFSRS